MDWSLDPGPIVIIYIIPPPDEFIEIIEFLIIMKDLHWLGNKILQCFTIEVVKKSLK